jgi:cell division protein FtsL
MDTIIRLLRSKTIWLLALLLLIYLLVIVSKVVWQNYQVNQQVTQLKQEVDLLKQNNQELKAEIIYYGTPEYQEMEARAKLGLQKPGEQVVLVPNDKSKPQTPATKTVKKQTNVRAWWEFFFGSGLLAS